MPLSTKGLCKAYSKLRGLLLRVPSGILESTLLDVSEFADLTLCEYSVESRFVLIGVPGLVGVANTI